MVLTDNKYQLQPDITEQQLQQHMRDFDSLPGNVRRAISACSSGVSATDMEKYILQWHRAGVPADEIERRITSGDREFRSMERRLYASLAAQQPSKK